MRRLAWVAAKSTRCNVHCVSLALCYSARPFGRGSEPHVFENWFDDGADIPPDAPQAIRWGGHLRGRRRQGNLQVVILDSQRQVSKRRPYTIAVYIELLGGLRLGGRHCCQGTRHQSTCHRGTRSRGTFRTGIFVLPKLHSLR